MLNGNEDISNPITITGIGGDPNQGPFFIFKLAIVDQFVSSVNYRTFSCPWASGIGMAAAALIEKKTIQVCVEISEGKIIDFIGEPIPRNKRDLLVMVCDAIHDAVNNYNATITIKSSSDNKQSRDNESKINDNNTVNHR